MYQDECVCGISDYGAKNFARMSESFVKRAFRNINQEDQASLCIQENDSKDLLIQKLQVGTDSVDRFGILEQLRTSVFTSNLEGLPVPRFL